MKKIVLFVLMITIVLLITSCTRSVSITIEKGAITNSRGEHLEYYIGKKSKSNLSNKLLVMIQGSGRESITEKFGMGAEGATLGYDVLYLEKYGYNEKELYNKTNCRERRVEDIEFVLDCVIGNIYDNNLKEVLILADSEGGSIAPEIANNIDKVTHMIIMGAGGYSQAKEFEILLNKELENDKEGNFKKAGIKNQQELITKLIEISNNPTYEKYWLGHTYKYWDSYLNYKAEKYLDKIKIPVLYIIGKEDKSVPYQSVEYLSNKFSYKKNFTFEIIPELNHSFTDKSGNNKLKEIMKKIILPWLKKY